MCSIVSLVSLLLDSVSLYTISFTLFWTPDIQVGKIDPKKHLETSVEELMTANIWQWLGAMLGSRVLTYT